MDIGSRSTMLPQDGSHEVVINSAYGGIEHTADTTTEERGVVERVDVNMVEERVGVGMV